MSTFYLEDFERTYIDRLRAAGIPYADAYLCILMYFKEISRPIGEMPAIISRYSANLTEESIRKSYDKLMSNGLIEKGHYGDIEVYKTVADYENKLEKYTAIKGLALELMESKMLLLDTNHENSKVKLTARGVVSAEGNYSTLLSRLQSAHNTVKAAMLCSKVYEETAVVFEEMASKGVKIQLLVGSTELVKKVRGSSTDGTFLAWKKRLQINSNIEVRQFSRASAAELCSSYLIDDSVLRLVVFDYATMPSLDGYLIEVVQKTNSNINLVHWYKTKFDEEWQAAEEPRVPKAVRIIFSLYVISIIVTALLIIYLVCGKPEGLLYDGSLMIIGACISYIARKTFGAVRRYFKKVSTAMKNVRE